MSSALLRLRASAPGNWARAKCRKINAKEGNDPFFDEDPQPAVDYCNGDADGTLCPIRHECLLFALVNRCEEGVWGGCDDLTRKAITKRWPLRKGFTASPEWKWMDRDTALAGLDAQKLRKELEGGSG